MIKIKLALIPPIGNIGATRWTNYQLMLPHLTWEEKYVRTYQKRRHDSYIILDNGAADKGLVHPEDMLHHAKGMMVNEIVLPDVMGDAEQTLAGVMAFAQRGLPMSFNYMAVLQGSSMGELRDCARAYATQEWITCIGIPRHILSNIEIARVLMVDFLRQDLGWMKDIHLLGMHREYPFEIRDYGGTYRTANVRGVDTSLPFIYSLAGEELWKGNYNGDRPEAYFNLGTGLEKTELSWVNIITMMRWVRGDLD